MVGKTVVLNGAPHTIVGVMPARFTWHAGDVWIPRRLDAPAVDGQPIVHNFQARLKPGVTTRQAEAQLNLIAARRAREHPAEYPTAFQVQVLNVIEYTVGSFSTVLYTTYVRRATCDVLCATCEGAKCRVFTSRAMCE